MRVVKKLNEEKLLFFDIETAPVVKELELDTPLFDSWEYKVNKSGEMSNEEIIKSFSKEAGLYPEFAKIICIVVGKIQNKAISLVTLNDPEEDTLLKKFNSVVNRNSGDKLTGFQNIGFDTPFVFKRMIINGIKPHPSLDSSGLKPWEVDELDLSKYWQGTSFNRGSLINISVALGLPSPKDDISGADVGRVYWEGDLEKISKYCEKDVIATINVFKKMRLEDPLEVSTEVFRKKTLLEKLFGGAKYNKKEKEALEELLRGMNKNDRDNAFVILYSMVSGAKGKKTSMTKAHVNSLKRLFV
jgi:predicted PolB exonuclease-like 3'-5' exonuclease